MGKAWREEVGFDPVFKEQGGSGCVELGKWAFKGKGFPALSKKGRDAGVYAR